jgi:hypothetical protein
MLLGGEPRLRLKPVCEVGSAAGDSPVLHHLGNYGRNFRIEFSAEADRIGEFLIDFGRQFVAHLPRAESIYSEVFRCAYGTAVIRSEGVTGRNFPDAVETGGGHDGGNQLTCEKKRSGDRKS